jgi:hypothetical protein
MRIIIPHIERHSLVKRRKLLDATFSDTGRYYPSLKAFEACSPIETQGWERGGETYKRICTDQYFPCLKAMGKLPV